MNKNQLQNRMIVELRSGDRYMVVDDLLLNGSGCFNLDNFTDDLKHIDPKYREDDIVKVYDLARCLSNIEDCHYTRNVIWERDEYFTGKAVYVGDSLNDFAFTNVRQKGYTPGKIYEFKDGYTFDDDGDRRPIGALRDKSLNESLREDELESFGFYPITD